MGLLLTGLWGVAIAEALAVKVGRLVDGNVGCVIFGRGYGNWWLQRPLTCHVKVEGAGGGMATVAVGCVIVDTVVLHGPLLSIGYCVEVAKLLAM